ncbi:hypothetical protein CUR43_13530 [Enterococcus faecium]|nr:DUF1064 domain-containing protein [Enterococcus faecium]RRQ56458.1 hypothetical protein CUR43_13530 [Enterococcus faecium]
MNKYRNRKTVHRGIKFDSIAEAKYYDLALWQAEANGWKVKLQERFELMPKFELDGKKYRKIEYIPDFTFYKNGKLVKVVDVKGMQTKDFKIKAKFEKEYGVSAEEAYKVANQGVADASGAIRKFGISILSDDRKWEEKE